MLYILILYIQLENFVLSDVGHNKIKKKYFKVFLLVLFNIIIFLLVGFDVAPTQYRSNGDFSALLVEEDLWCLSVHYLRHKRAPATPSRTTDIP
jgi:hypothetical protein